MATNKQTMDSSGRSSAIFGPIPRHRQLYEGKRWQPGPRDEWNPDLPYGGKVYLARKKKAPGWVMRIFEVSESISITVLVLLLALLLLLVFLSL